MTAFYIEKSVNKRREHKNRTLSHAHSTNCNCSKGLSVNCGASTRL